MDNVKNDRYYLNKIIADLKFLIENTAGLSQEEVEKICF